MRNLWTGVLCLGLAAAAQGRSQAATGAVKGGISIDGETMVAGFKLNEISTAI